jgi:hypothetical protein
MIGIPDRDVCLIDLDGTLADITHRLPLIHREPPDWDAFYKACSDDKPNQWCVELMSAMCAAGKRVIIVSARSRVVFNETMTWLQKHADRAFTDCFMLRAEGDNTPDQILKKAWLESSGLKDRILLVVDDRTRMVDSWRESGLVCLQCQRWEEYKRPKKEVAA